MLIFVLQSIWLYISELAGKDLDIATVGKFLLYITPTLIPLILPLTILLASIMVFGNFAENYEFAAMKSTGISLQRAMKSLSIFIVFLGVVTFFFSNNVIPRAAFESYNLRRNIAKLKPAMAIAEGQFNQVGNINIKVAEKSGDRGQYLKDVVIHKKSSRIGNYTTIVSKTGELISSEDSEVLKLILFDGNYYDELQPKDFKERQKKPFAKSYFETYTINIDLSQINNVDLENKQVTSKYDMLTVNELTYTIDSLNERRVNKKDQFFSNIQKRTTLKVKSNDEKVVKQKDTLTDGDLLSIFDTKKKIQLVDMASNNLTTTYQLINAKNKELKGDLKWLNKHIIAFHDKFALGFACIILFFVGAPLGALIKKGGLGLPMVIAIVLFLIYHFIGIFAKNSAEDNSLNPILASWLSTLIMLPVGIYLTDRATKDKGLFDIDLILQPIKRLLKIKETGDEDTSVSLSAEDYAVLKTYSNEKLIDIIKNYRQYDYTVSFKKTSIDILEDRGVSEEELRLSGNLSNQRYEEAASYHSDYDQNAGYALKLYLVSIILLVLYFVFNNNKLPGLAKGAIVTCIISTVFYLIFIGKSFLSQTKFYKILKKENTNNIMLFTILGLPVNFLVYYFFKRKMKEELKQVR